MSRPVRERIAELEADVQHLRLAPAAAVRARGRSRARRRRAGTTAALAVVVGAAGFGVVSLTGGSTGDRIATSPAAPSATCAIPADLALPADPAAVVIKVVGRSDQVSRVTIELGQRGFSASELHFTDPDADRPGPVAVLRYGPRGIGSATVVRALIDGDVVMKFQPDREVRTVDLALGADFRRLATATEMNRSLVELGAPTSPPGGC
jgi:hypothetical protein